MKKINFTKLFTSLVVFGVLLRSWLNSQTLVASWDESIYARLGLEHGLNFLDSYYNGQLWLEKPPLISILTFLPQYLFPNQKLFLGLVFTAVSIGCLWMIYRLSQKLIHDLSLSDFKLNNQNLKANFEEKYLAFIPVAVCISASIFLERSVIVNVDILLVFSYLGYYYFYDKKWAKLVFTLTGVWAKSLLGFLPLLIDILLNFRSWRKPKKLLELLIIILTSCSWYIYSWAKYGDRFINDHFGDHLIKRASTAIEFHSGGWDYYILRTIEYGTINILALIASILVIIFIGLQYFRQFKSKVKINSLSIPNFHFWREFLSLGIAYFLLINISQSKLDWYILPATVWSGFFLMIYLGLVKKSIWKTVLISSVIVISLLNLFLTPLPNRNSTKDIELAELAKCIQPKNYPKLAFLVDQSERENKLKIQGTEQILGSSFRYGGTPIFLYYSRKNIDFYYSQNEFNSNFSNYSAIVLPKSDVAESKLGDNGFKSGCESSNFVEYSR